MADARDIACRLLDAVLTEGVPLDSALSGQDGMDRLDPRDRGQARRIVTGVLRHLGEIDAILKDQLDRPLPARYARMRNVLRVGIAELVFLGTPPHAAVDAAVKIAARYRRGALKGLVNAVLRGITRAQGDDPGFGHAADPARTNTPGWLFQRWEAAYGAETAAAIATAHMAEPPLDLTLKRAANPQVWAARLDATLLPGGGLRRTGGGRVPELLGYDDGIWWVQDAAAALPAQMLGDVAGQSVIDLCAAPGGKTLQLSDAGARVTALDIADSRLGALQENLGRTGLVAEIVCADATKWRPESPVDAVLLDASCSATGTIRRHPDIPHRRTAKDIANICAIQARLLAAAMEMVRPGGVIVYAVCSLEPEEGPGQVAALIEGGAPVTLDPLDPADWPGLEAAITPNGTLRTLPCHGAERGGMDGFFAARLVRT